MNFLRPVLVWLLLAGTLLAAEFRGTIVDADSGKPVASRVYLQGSDGEWLFVETASKDGSALAYREQWVPMVDSVDKHTTVSAHPFRIELNPGEYTLTVERGKEYFTFSMKITIGDEDVAKTIRLKRWVNLAERGWFSGETHVHRRIEELPNVMLAEDLNVAFPVTFWTINAYEKPGLAPSPLRRQGPSPFGPRKDVGPNVVKVDATHVFFPRNTEYEIFSVNGERIVQGAVFVLNHRSVFREGMPPVARLAEKAHQEGALLDLDKHSWPWAMMLVPIAKVDLFELSNNSVWRTKFGFRRSSSPIAPYMKVERDADGALTEFGWLNFGFENYYSLLNCGFRMQPTAGTASGVHPVPLGHSRVYVYTGKKFEPEAWLDGLRQGRSFVTTGPMLFATLDEALPGEVFRQKAEKHNYLLRFESISERPVDRMEIIVNGEVMQTAMPRRESDAKPPYRSEFSLRIGLDESSWIAVRSFQKMPDGRFRFAHTAPWHIEVDGQPVKPRREEVEYLISRVKNQIERNKNVLQKHELAEFEKAQSIYEGILKRAVNRKRR